jgi:U3 small nucleolar RNA-associated protein 23
MKHGRAKAARKTLKFFSLNANIKPAYKVILDGNFLAAAMRYKVPLFDRIGKILQTNEFTLFVTRSALVELDKLPKDNPIFSDARQFGLDECEIIERFEKNNSSSNKKRKDNESNNDNDAEEEEEEEELTPSQDIENLVKDGNKQGYFVATQDKKLSDTLRNMIYIPQMWLTKGVLIFDTPSAVSRKASQRDEREKQKTGGGTMTPDESELIQRLRAERIRKNNQVKGVGGRSDGNTRGKRKASEPNPLSCKKKKTNQKQKQPSGDGSTKKKRRKRNKNKVES